MSCQPYPAFLPENRERAIVEIRMSEGTEGRWTIYASGLVVTDLTHEQAEAFAESYRRITGG